MKKFFVLALFAALAMPCAAQADVVAGWETWNNTTPSPATLTNGATGSVEKTGWSISIDAASTDGTFGTLALPAADATDDAVNDGVFLANGVDGSLIFTITDTSGVARDLEAFHFDYTRFRFGSAENWTVDITAGDLSNVNVGSGTVGVYNTDKNLPDFDLDLTALADSTLDALGSVTFTLAITGGNLSAGQHSYVDNVAVTSVSAPVPEPSSLALFGLAGIGMLVRRRK